MDLLDFIRSAPSPGQARGMMMMVTAAAVLHWLEA